MMSLLFLLLLLFLIFFFLVVVLLVVVMVKVFEVDLVPKRLFTGVFSVCLFALIFKHLIFALFTEHMRKKLGVPEAPEDKTSAEKSSIVSQDAGDLSSSSSTEQAVTFINRLLTLQKGDVLYNFCFFVSGLIFLEAAIEDRGNEIGGTTLVLLFTGSRFAHGIVCFFSFIRDLFLFLFCFFF